ncbi:MAG: hypothetical protein AB8G05_19575 [Oligoflexales bacterium]
MTEIEQIIFGLVLFIVGCYITSKFFSFPQKKDLSVINSSAVFIKGGKILGVGSSEAETIALTLFNHPYIKRESIKNYDNNLSYGEGTILLIPCSNELRKNFLDGNVVLYVENENGYLESKHLPDLDSYQNY